MPKKTQKPSVPYKDFPLYAHGSGQWAKKIKGKVWYFGKWEDWEEAVERYKAEVHDIQAGRDPRKLASVSGGTNSSLTVVHLVNTFLTEKERQMNSGRLSKKMFIQYREACKVLIDYVGRTTTVVSLRPQDFSALAASFPETWGVSMIGGTIGRIRSVFIYAYESDLIDRPTKFGPGFARPSKLEKRREQSRKVSERGRLDFTAEQVRAIIAATKNKTLKACILLALNGGLGNSDCAKITTSNVDLKKGWVDFPRPKTGMERRFPLWPETIKAIAEATAKRPAPKSPEFANRLFLTREGMPLVWDKLVVREEGKQTLTGVNNLSLTFGRLLKKLKLAKRDHNFYSLRRVFETVAGASKDQVAVNVVMGHDDGSMANVYRQGVADERLQSVVNFVRAWLFGEPGV